MFYDEENVYLISFYDCDGRWILEVAVVRLRMTHFFQVVQAMPCTFRMRLALHYQNGCLLFGGDLFIQLIFKLG